MDIAELYKLYKKCSGGITTDSRNVARDSMFFALKGDTFDGNEFARKALEAGARYAIVDKPTLSGLKAGRGECILVENVLMTLQKLASHHRSQFDIPVIGITGTNGKTTTKELITAVLSRKYNVVSTKGNFNNHIGVPLTLLRINERTEIAVVEMGASHPGEIAELTALTKPTCGLITNVGKAHILGFGSFEGVKKTKGELYRYLRQSGGPAFFNADNPHLVEMTRANKGLVLRPYGVKKQGATILSSSLEEPFLRIQMPDAGPLIKTHLIGGYNADNVMAAICVGTHFGVCLPEIRRAIEGYTPSNDRSQMVRTERNTLIVDTYNANPTSMEASLSNFRNTGFDNKTLILGDMLELGDESAPEHFRILSIAASTAEEIFLVGKEFTAAALRLNCSKTKCFATSAELAEALKASPVEGRTILIKGSHGIHLEKLPEVL